VVENFPTGRSCDMLHDFVRPVGNKVSLTFNAIEGILIKVSEIIKPTKAEILIKEIFLFMDVLVNKSF
jgi:hypothetical protein